MACAVAVASFAGPARAAAPPAAEPSAPAPAPETTGPNSSDEGEKAALAAIPATRRSGFTAGIMTGLSFGNVSGYPNDLAKLDNPIYHSGTSGIGSGGTLYLGGALTDWFTFGFGIAQSSFGSGKIVTKGGAFVFHIEAFPLFARGGIYRDLGLFADFGTGTATIKRVSDQAEFSSSGSLSIAGLGAFWETWRFAGHLAVGPFGLVQYQASNAMERVLGEIGVRGTFYGGP